MSTILLTLATALAPLQTGCDSVASVVHRFQGSPAGPVEIGQLGLPLIGGGLPTLVVEGGASNSVGWLGVGVDSIAVPIGAGGTLFTLPLVLVPFTLDAGGRVELDVAPGYVLPPSLCGSVFSFQAGVLDAGAPGGLWFSDGLELHAGEPFPLPAFGGAMFGEVDKPVHAVPADFDGDGTTDLLVVEVLQRNVVTLLGDGQGGFVQAASANTGIDAMQVALADFDEDGVLDALVGHTQSDAFFIPGVDREPLLLLGTGGGTFGPGQQLPTGEGGGVAAGDMNGDGHADAVCLAGGEVDELVVLHGDGTGGFAAPVRVPVAVVEAGRVELGDLDGNGTLDVVVSGRAAIGGGGVASNDRLILVLNDGQGGYSVSPQSPLIAAHRIQHFALADADANGTLDILGAGLSGPRLTAFLNDGSGAFPNQPFTAFGGAAGFPGAPGEINGLTTHDFDGDGVPDLALTFPESDVLSLYRGKGDGRFSFESARGAARTPAAVVVTDTDGDGVEDVVACHGIFDGGLLVLPRVEGFELLGPQHGATGAQGSDITRFPDHDHGTPDLAVVDRTTGEVDIVANDGTGELQVVQTAATAPGAVAIELTDVDLDGIVDVVVVNETDESVDVALGLPDGSYGPMIRTPLTPGSEPQDLTIGDFDEDGVPDVVVANLGRRSWMLLLGVGDGTFALAFEEVIPDSLIADVIACDVNADGHQDVAVVMEASFFFLPEIIVLTGAGDGTFTPVFDSAALGTTLDLAVGDINGDGYEDIAMADVLGSTWVVWGGPSLGPGSLYRFDHARPERVAVGDVDGDGLDDIAILVGEFLGKVVVLRAPTAGALTLEVMGEYAVVGADLLDSSTAITGVEIADIDGDQRGDLLVSVSGGPGSIGFSLQRTPSPLDE